jgi:hypothetical protein
MSQPSGELAGFGSGAAALVFFTAAARTWIITAGSVNDSFGIARAHYLHELLARFPGLDQLGEFF